MRLKNCFLVLALFLFAVGVAESGQALEPEVKRSVSGKVVASGKTSASKRKSLTVRISKNKKSQITFLSRVNRAGRRFACYHPASGTPVFGIVRHGIFKQSKDQGKHLAIKHPALLERCMSEAVQDLEGTDRTSKNTSDTTNLTFNEEGAAGPQFSEPAGFASGSHQAEQQAENVQAPAPGDANGDGCADGSDFLAWQRQFGSNVTPGTQSDWNGDGTVNAADYVVWRASFGKCGAEEVSQPPPIPYFDQWKSQMLTYGQTHCNKLKDLNLNFDSKLAATYYDAEWVFYQIGDFTNDSKWYQCAQAAEAVYRSLYVIPNNGVVPGYWNFSHGVQRDFLSTGDMQSKSALVLLAKNASYAPDSTPLAWTADSTMSREVAYAIMSYLNAETVGEPARARREQLVEQAFGHLDQWFVLRNAPYVRPFMFSLTAHALISYDTQIGSMNQRTVNALAIGANWIWNNMWLEDKEAFKYTDRNVESGGTEPAPDLNLLIAPVYAWLYHQTGDVVYRDRADKIFAGGVKSAYLVNAKQFNQNYRWSFDYIKWRNASPLK